MKRWIALLAGFAAAMLIAPSQDTDIASLQPVELLYIYKEGGRVTVETDTGDLGAGGDLQGAMEDLKNTTPGEVFLDTAQYLLITESAEAYLPELKQILRPAAQVLRTEAEPDLETAVKYLSVHRSGLALKDWRAGMTIPKLTIKEGRYYLVQ